MLSEMSSEEGFEASEDHFWFIAVEFEEVALHLGFYISEAVCKSGEYSRSDGFCGDIKLCLISVAVKS